MLENESTVIIGIKFTLIVDNSSRWSRRPSKWGCLRPPVSARERLMRAGGARTCTVRCGPGPGPRALEGGTGDAGSRVQSQAEATMMLNFSLSTFIHSKKIQCSSSCSEPNHLRSVKIVRSDTEIASIGHFERRIKIPENSQILRLRAV